MNSQALEAYYAAKAAKFIRKADFPVMVFAFGILVGATLIGGITSLAFGVTWMLSTGGYMIISGLLLNFLDNIADAAPKLSATQTN